jgi:hypothetical protein
MGSVMTQLVEIISFWDVRGGFDVTASSRTKGKYENHNEKCWGQEAT